MTARILIVEDERDLAAIVADYATAAGYTTEIVADGHAALAQVRRAPPDLIVLDIMLPGIDGIALCREIRGFSDVPVIMLTAKVEEIDRLLGLETGADDYVCKPFSPRELMARVAAVLRRRRDVHAASQVVAVDDEKRTIRVHARALDLTATEHALLAAMVRRPGVIFSRVQLLDIAGGDNLEVGDRAIDTHIKNLRRKIAALAPEANVIHSVYGLGYRFDP